MADDAEDVAIWVALNTEALGNCLPVARHPPPPPAPTAPQFTLDGFFAVTTDAQSATYATNAMRHLCPPFVAKI